MRKLSDNFGEDTACCNYELSRHLEQTYIRQGSELSPQRKPSLVDEADTDSNKIASTVSRGALLIVKIMKPYELHMDQVGNAKIENRTRFKGKRAITLTAQRISQL